jgi:hypothetical protein
VVAPRDASAAGSIDAYRGIGAWVDMYDSVALTDPVSAVRVMASHGVRTLFLQTGNYRHARAVVYSRQTDLFIEAAHAQGIRVVGWYLPLFRDVALDLRQCVAAIAYRTSHGQAFDGFAMDIEADVVPPGVRIANLLRLSSALRRTVGRSYALGAIIPSPRGLIRVPGYWPGFPYAALPRYYDVVLPMSYYTFHYEGPDAVERYIRDNIEVVRRATGDPSIPVHVIGGLSEDTSNLEAVAFARAISVERPFGASLYEYAGTTVFEWSLLERMARA